MRLVHPLQGLHADGLHGGASHGGASHTGVLHAGAVQAASEVERRHSLCSCAEAHCYAVAMAMRTDSFTIVFWRAGGNGAW